MKEIVWLAVLKSMEISRSIICVNCYKVMLLRQVPVFIFFISVQREMKELTIEFLAE